MAARSGFRDGVERERVLPAGVHQPLVGGWLPARLTPEHRLERHTAAHQPVEVLDAARTIVGDAVLVGAWAHRDVQECRHVVDGIVEATGLLQPGAAAEVDEPAGHRRRAAPASGALDDQDVGTRLGGLDRRGGARDAVTRDDDVGFVVPVLDLLGRGGVDVRVHRYGRIAAGRSLTHWWPQ